MICFWLGGRRGESSEKNSFSLGGGGGACGKKLHARGGGEVIQFRSGN